MIAYHVAPKSARTTISIVGLLPSKPNPRWEKYGNSSQPFGVYVWESYGRACKYAQDFYRLMGNASCGECDVYRVDLYGLRCSLDPILGDQGAVYTTETVPADRLKRIS